MFKSIKYFMLLAFMASFVSFTAFANDNCDYDDQGDFNTDDNCGTASATCEWTFQLVCPAEITCEEADLGIFCIGETITPTGNDNWVTFNIGGEVGRPFALTVNVDENAQDADGDYDENLVINGLTWQVSTNNGTSFSAMSALNMDADGVNNSAFNIPSTTTYANGACVGADESGYVLRVRPTSISTTNATSAGVYTVRISLGVDFGYSL